MPAVQESTLSSKMALMDAMLPKPTIVYSSLDKRLQERRKLERGTKADRMSEVAFMSKMSAIEPSLQRGAEVEPTRVAPCWQPESLLGMWMDSYGNQVSVHWTDQPEAAILATLSRSPRPDIELSVWQTSDGVMHCGDAKLDPSRSFGNQVTWVFPDGRVSTWTWQEATYDGGDGIWADANVSTPQDKYVPVLVPLQDFFQLTGGAIPADQLYTPFS